MPLTVEFLEIPADTSISEGLQCLSGRIVRIGMPDDWTAAPLTFRVSPNGVNYLTCSTPRSPRVFHAL